MAEKEGFEPSIPLWGIHDFQSCALDRATRLLHIWCRSSERMLLYDEMREMSTPNFEKSKIIFRSGNACGDGLNVVQLYQLKGGDVLG